MILSAMLLSRSITFIVLEPLERLLSEVNEMGQSLFKSVLDLGQTVKRSKSHGSDGDDKTDLDDEFDDEDQADEADNELKLLRDVVKQLGEVSKAVSDKGPVSEENMKNLNRDELGVLSMLQESINASHAARFAEETKTGEEGDDGSSPKKRSIVGGGGGITIPTAFGVYDVFTDEKKLGVPLQTFQTWNFDSLELTVS
jgi:hypothetical protein